MIIITIIMRQNKKYFKRKLETNAEVFWEKTLRNIAVGSCCQAVSINSYSNVLSEFSSMYSRSAPDKYTQNMPSKK